MQLKQSDKFVSITRLIYYFPLISFCKGKREGKKEKSYKCELCLHGK